MKSDPIEVLVARDLWYKHRNTGNRIGKTIEIFVSRMNIYKDAMAELVTEPPIEDISFPLEVTFIGEEAADYGGPRKEFLGAVMRDGS